MNRRKFLGFLGISAVAAPQVAMNSLEGAADLRAPGLMGYLPSIYGDEDGPVGAAKSTGVINAVSRMAKLHRLISGQETEDPNPYSVAETRRLIEERNIVALGSMSQVAKLRKMTKAAAAIEAEKQKGFWQRELDRLMKGDV